MCGGRVREHHRNIVGERGPTRYMEERDLEGSTSEACCLANAEERGACSLRDCKRDREDSMVAGKGLRGLRGGCVGQAIDS